MPTPTTPPATDRRPGPAEALANLLAGNLRFVAGQPHYGHDVTAASATADGQEPDAVVLGCIDSRVPLEAVFDQGFGAICVVRSGGGVLDRAIVGSVEFAVQELTVPLVVVLGHERCGAIAATIAALRSGKRPGGGLGYLVDAIAPAVLDSGLDHPDVQTRALRRHVRSTVTRLRATAGPVEEHLSSGGVAVVGAIYDLDTGRVELLR